MDPINRRTFLTGMAAATPFVFGLGSLLGQDEKGPEFFRKALKKMKATGRHGVVIVGPNQQTLCNLVGSQLLALIDGSDAPSHELFTGAVWICLTFEAAKACLPDRPEGKNRLLLDPEGKRIDADEVAVNVFSKTDTFAATFSKFLFGSDAKRLEAWGDKVVLTEEEKAAIKNMDAEALETRDAALALLAKNGERLYPALVAMRNRAVAEEAKARFSAILERHFQNCSTTEAGPRLPYGTERVNEEIDTCPSCGMMKNPPKAQAFLKFMTK